MGPTKKGSRSRRYPPEPQGRRAARKPGQGQGPEGRTKSVWPRAELGQLLYKKGLWREVGRRHM